MTRFNTWGAAATVIGAVLASQSQASYVKVDDFESYTVGPSIHNQGSWKTAGLGAGASATVAVDPVDAGNNVLRFVGFSYQAYSNSPALALANNTTGTLFLRAYFSSTSNADTSAPAGPDVNVPFGLAEATAGAPDFADYAAYVRLNGGSLDGRDGATFDSLATGIDAGAWYNVWLVVDNTTNTYEVYLQSDDDPTYTTQTRISPALGDADPLNFRANNVSATDALAQFNIRTGTENSANQPVLFDDLYFDPAGANLVNPIPEPASLGAVGLALLAGLRRRR